MKKICLYMFVFCQIVSVYAASDLPDEPMVGSQLTDKASENDPHANKEWENRDPEQVAEWLREQQQEMFNLLGQAI